MMIYLAGLPARVLRPATGSDNTLHGPSSRCSRLTVVGTIVSGANMPPRVRLFDDVEQRQQTAGHAAPPMLLLTRHAAHTSYALIPWTPDVTHTPVAVMGRFFAGGNFADLTDGAGADGARPWVTLIPAVAEYAIPVHDRDELRWRPLVGYAPPHVPNPYEPLAARVGDEESVNRWRYHGALVRRGGGRGDVILRFQYLHTGRYLNLHPVAGAYHVTNPASDPTGELRVTPIGEDDAIGYATGCYATPQPE